MYLKKRFNTHMSLYIPFIITLLVVISNACMFSFDGSYNNTRVYIGEVSNCIILIYIF